MIRLPATPARNDLQALAADGYSVAWIAEQLGMSHSAVNRLRRGETARTSEYTIAAVARLRQRLAGSSPAEHGIPERVSAVVRLSAARRDLDTKPVTQ